MLFSIQDALQSYIAAGIVIVVLLSTVLFLKPRQPIPETRGPARSSSEIQGASSPNGFFHKARNFVLNNPIITYYQGEDQSPRIMELLVNHIIHGAAHDDSARTYPPRCHPGTRIKILERLTDWIYSLKRTKSLLWLSGPAGVGKSAVMQTLAESIRQPVASVFISRPNNDPNRIFTTIAYQLAVQVEAYRNYVVGRLAANPYLLNKTMQIQFQVLIVEPFVERKIGAGGLPLAILLDGLDEVEGANAQRDIIRLISTFTREHPDVPLAWIISSRPEPHITNTLNEVQIEEVCESESLPMDSTDACKDVERSLRASFEIIRREFPHPPLGNWPEETALVKLANASSGLFIFAETAVRFIRDPDYANPVQRLRVVLSVIDRSQGVSIEEWPFALLDALYTELLSSIPSGLLPITKLLMKVTLFFRNSEKPFVNSAFSKSWTLRGMAIILQLDHHTVYAALNKCFSTLDIPPWEFAHCSPIKFLHASFVDYLMDAKRSGDFHIDLMGAEDDVLLVYLNLWHKHFGEESNSNTSLFNEYHAGAENYSSKRIEEFNASLIKEMADYLLKQIVMCHSSRPAAAHTLQQKRLECLDSIRRVNMISLCDRKLFGKPERPPIPESLASFAKRTFDKAWEEFPHELQESGFIRHVPFKDINCDPHDLKEHHIFIHERVEYGILGMYLRYSPKEPRQELREAFLSQSPELPEMKMQRSIVLFRTVNRSTLSSIKHS
ncbi:hypothetical protein Agabi119p4_10318 [Agaricus bisporus var. burnettii]|uniref:Nephrocystin 3-like N-terminal domain-containing protein n=1 Tax=Agaricus bisporus var. burnettii TaxID=192524 RepID=A0A8H7C3D3_AGABI|nr:hypothetical protein Agabi119p4_10318 [Agaricus bisporus var. burnettii]